VPERLKQLNHWLRHDLGLPEYEIAPASSDASFRRYFRVRFGDESRIAMDAPPEKEAVEPFIRVAEMFRGYGLHVPHILERDPRGGFLLLSDLGSEQYLQRLDESTVGWMYSDAMEALAALQAQGPREADILPYYTRELLNREMELFRIWFLGRHLGLELTGTEQDLLNDAFAVLADNALEQPTVTVHRDYHSRNLMVTEPNPGILDFQDAVIGPLTYDLVSLLRDCYIAWPRKWVEQWALGFHDLVLGAGVTDVRDQGVFLRWFDLMGVQRHLKAIGIFARLNHRDGKSGYLGDIPRTLGYVVEVAGRYPQLEDLRQFLDARVLPAVE
jgi:aminoglycoside/choline kinase family phosphotransferase